MFRAVKNIKNAFVVIALACGFTFAVFMLNKEREEAKETLNWPTVIGEITYSKIGSEQSRDSDGRMQTMYYPSFKYTYSVDGIEYKGDKYEFTKTTSSSSSSSQEAVSQFPVGKKVEVFYNPIQENDAILKPGIPFIINLFFYVFGTVVSVMWLIILTQFVKIVFGVSLVGIFLAKKGSRKVIGGESNQAPMQTTREQSKPATHSDDAFDMK